MKNPAVSSVPEEATEATEIQCMHVSHCCSHSLLKKLISWESISLENMLSTGGLTCCTNSPFKKQITNAFKMTVKPETCVSERAKNPSRNQSVARRG